MIVVLVLGVLLWSIAHLFPSVAIEKRMKFVESLGKGYEGLFALTIVFSIVLIVIGWRNTVPEQLYYPPVWGRHLAMLLMLFVMILFTASHGSSRIKGIIRHPMLTAMLVWSVAHLLANGDSRSVILFSGMAVWSVLNQITINKRDGNWIKSTEKASMMAEVALVGKAAVAFVALMFLHRHFTGVSLFSS